MNPRQRRGVLLMIVAGLGAFAVFATVFVYTSSLRNELGEFQTVLRVTQDVPPFSEITPEMVEETEVPSQYFEETFISDLGQLPSDDEETEAVAAALIEEGSLLQRGMLAPAPDLDSGEREIAIMVNAETGVAGKISSGSLVDVVATFGGSENSPPCALRVLTEVSVVDIGAINAEEGATGPGAVPVTFSLDPESVLQLTFAETFATTTRLSLVSPQGGGDPGASDFCPDNVVEDFEDGFVVEDPPVEGAGE